MASLQDLMQPAAETSGGRAASRRCRRARTWHVFGVAAALALGVCAFATHAGAQPAPSASATEGASSAAPEASAAPTGDDPEARNTSFRGVEGGGNNRSGELLLIEAYAVIWVVIFGMLLLSLRRHVKLRDRITKLEVELAKTRAAAGEGAGAKSAAKATAPRGKPKAGSDAAAPPAEPDAD